MSEQLPFSKFGKRIKFLREAAKESLLEVSGAVEIDSQKLEAIELGAQKPEEDLVLLLISHFNVKDDEAMRLWELAGYDQEPDYYPSQNSNTSGNNNSGASSTEPGRTSQPAVMVLPIDARIVFTDSVQVLVNDHGVVINFLQGAQQSPLAVSRVGMSKEHAYSVIKVLQDTLDHHYADKSPKQLASGKPAKARRQVKTNKRKPKSAQQ